MFFCISFIYIQLFFLKVFADNELIQYVRHEGGRQHSQRRRAQLIFSQNSFNNLILCFCIFFSLQGLFYLRIRTNKMILFFSLLKVIVLEQFVFFLSRLNILLRVPELKQYCAFFNGYISIKLININFFKRYKGAQYEI